VRRLGEGSADGGAAIRVAYSFRNVGEPEPRSDVPDEKWANVRSSARFWAADTEHLGRTVRRFAGGVRCAEPSVMCGISTTFLQRGLTHAYVPMRSGRSRDAHRDSGRVISGALSRWNADDLAFNAEHRGGGCTFRSHADLIREMCDVMRMRAWRAAPMRCHSRIPALVCLVLALSLSASSPAGGVAGFGDVAVGRFYTAPVQWMVDNEITTGTSPTCFSPDDPVTRGQAAAFMWRMQGFPPPGAAHPFSDVVCGVTTGPGVMAVQQRNHHRFDTHDVFA